MANNTKLDEKSMELIETLVDHLETTYGNIEGIEVQLDHEPNEEIATIKRVVLYYIHKTEFEL